MMTWPKPVQKPHPPVILGGAFPWAARRAIRYGDGWYPNAASGNPEETSPAFATSARGGGAQPRFAAGDARRRAGGRRQAEALPRSRRCPGKRYADGGEGGGDSADPRPLGRVDAAIARVKCGSRLRGSTSSAFA